MAKLRSDPTYREKENQRRNELRKQKKQMCKIPTKNTSTPPITCFENGGIYPVRVKQTITIDTEYHHDTVIQSTSTTKEGNFIFINGGNELKRAMQNLTINKLHSFAKY